MGTRRMNRKARQFLLGRAEGPGWSGHWAMQDKPRHAAGVVQVRPFITVVERDAWVRQSPSTRRPVGKRHPLVKAYRSALRPNVRFAG